MQINIPKKEDEKEPTRVKVIFPTSAYFLSGIRDFTLQIIKNMSGFSDQWAFRFQSVVDELCNNAIEHGSAPNQEITLTFLINRDKKIEVTVEDTGTGIKPITADELRKIFTEKSSQDPTEMHEIRGRGLSHIIGPLTDEIHFEDTTKGGIKIRVVKFFT
ncbi:MAG: ATP-binding protein [Candidatus Gracilibacteria bacterium]|nr:ATP-binding protein [Candidatus Gracilibacteria bacterium]